MKFLSLSPFRVACVLLAACSALAPAAAGNPKLSEVTLSDTKGCVKVDENGTSKTFSFDYAKDALLTGWKASDTFKLTVTDLKNDDGLLQDNVAHLVALPNGVTLSFTKTGAMELTCGYKYVKADNSEPDIKILEGTATGDASQLSLSVKDVDGNRLKVSSADETILSYKLAPVKAKIAKSVACYSISNHAVFYAYKVDDANIRWLVLNNQLHDQMLPLTYAPIPDPDEKPANGKSGKEAKGKGKDGQEAVDASSSGFGDFLRGNALYLVLGLVAVIPLAIFLGSARPARDRHAANRRRYR